MNLAEDISIDPWRGVFKEKGRVHVPDLLTLDDARKLSAKLGDQRKWNLVYSDDGRHVDIDADSELLWSEQQKADFRDLVHSQATNQFQYLYKAIPIYDIYHQKLLPDHYLNEIFEFLNDAVFLDFARELLDMPTIGFADAQATSYTAGHFLTTHDDDVSGKNRLAAYVLNLTPKWHGDWGGALQFFDSEGGLDEAFLPSFNAINLFRVPQAHSVAYVAPFAGAARLSITGWLRAGDDPGLNA